MPKRQNIIVGIDNGITGGLAAIDATTGEPVAWQIMPTQSGRAGNEVDVLGVKLFLESLTDGIATIVHEEPGGSQSAKAAKSMAGSFHAVRAVCQLLGYRYERITPAKWQRVLLPGCKAGDTKPRALALFRELWPSLDVRKSERAKVQHDGVVDAFLMAEWGRRQRL